MDVGIFFQPLVKFMFNSFAVDANSKLKFVRAAVIKICPEANYHKMNFRENVNVD